MFFLFRLAAATSVLLHVGFPKRNPLSHRPPWTEMLEAVRAPLWLKVFLSLMAQDGTWKAEMLWGEPKPVE